MSVVMTGGGGISQTRAVQILCKFIFCTLCKVLEEKTSSDMGPKGKGIKGNPSKQAKGREMRSRERERGGGGPQHIVDAEAMETVSV